METIDIEWQKAIQSGDVNVIIPMLRSTPSLLETKDDLGRTGLLKACVFGHQEAVKLLISAGSNVNTQNNKGQTPLMLTCAKGNIANTKLLLDDNANVDLKDRDGWNALMYACNNGFYEIANLLLAKGALVNETNNEGCTALMLASYNGKRDTKLVSLLLSIGADTSTRCCNGKTALMYAVSARNEQIAIIFLREEFAVNPADQGQREVIIEAVRLGFTNLIKLLFALNTEINDINALFYNRIKIHLLLQDPCIQLKIESRIHELLPENLLIWKKFRLQQLFQIKE